MAKDPKAAVRKVHPSGAKALSHNGVMIDIEQIELRKAAMIYDEEKVEVAVPMDMSEKAFRAYLEGAADEMKTVLDEVNRRSKQRKASLRHLDEMRRSVALLTPENAGGGAIYARLLEQKSADVAHATTRAHDADVNHKMQIALLDEAKRRWADAS